MLFSCSFPPQSQWTVCLHFFVYNSIEKQALHLCRTLTLTPGQFVREKRKTLSYLSPSLMDHIQKALEHCYNIIKGTDLFSDYKR